MKKILKGLIATACFVGTTIGAIGLYGYHVRANEDKYIRPAVLRKLQKLEGREYAVTIEKSEIIARGNICANGLNYLEVKIKDKKTGDILDMIDYDVILSPTSIFYHFSGVDTAIKNGVFIEKEGLDKKFDNALIILKPELEKIILEYGK